MDCARKVASFSSQQSQNFTLPEFGIGIGEVGSGAVAGKLIRPELKIEN